MSSHAWKLALVAIAVAALAACGSPDEENPLDDFALPPGMEVPEMSIEVYQGADRLGGDEVALSQVLAQGKPVVLNFWAALCAPCRAEMPDLQRVHEQRQDEVSILGIDVGPQFSLGTREQGRKLLDELGVRYPAGTTFNQN
ncbi:MAG: TlpA disulfide reductase family protein, partial [Dehalococcoidia bacterium]